MRWFIIAVLAIGACSLMSTSIADMIDGDKERLLFKTLVRVVVLLVELAVFAVAVAWVVML